MTQDAMILMLSKYPHLTAEDEAIRVAVRILTNFRIAWWRKRKRRGEDTAAQADALPLPDGQDLQDTALDRNRAAKIVREQVAALDPRCRKVILLSLTGLKAKDLAAKLGMPSENAVNLAVSRCRGKLRGKLDRSLLEEI